MIRHRTVRPRSDEAVLGPLDRRRCLRRGQGRQPRADGARRPKAADEARGAVTDAEMPAWLADAIATAYEELCRGEPDVPIAVRSSATAEDTASASHT